MFPKLLLKSISLWITKTDKKPHSNRKEFDEAVIDWATKACHRCLVYLGDIGNVYSTIQYII